MWVIFGLILANFRLKNAQINKKMDGIHLFLARLCVFECYSFLLVFYCISVCYADYLSLSMLKTLEFGHWADLVSENEKNGKTEHF